MNIITSTRPLKGVMSSFIGGRSENQDSCGFSDTRAGLLAVVCDGMGGGPAGKTASTVASTAMIEYVQEHGTPDCDKSKLLVEAVNAANKALRDKIIESPELNGMGTTVVALILDDYCATMAHVGDSRAYQIRDKYCAFCTQDHSRVGEMVRTGALTKEQARLSAFSNIITRALGIGDEVETETDVRPYEKGDRFILCTDGIWGAMPEKDLVKEFCSQKTVEGTLDVLNMEVEASGKLNKNGQHDNYTAIIIETNSNSIMKEPISKRIKLLLQTLGIVCALSILLNIVLFCATRPGDQIKSLEEEVKELKETNASLTTKYDELKQKNDVLIKKASKKTADQKVVTEINSNQNQKQEKPAQEVKPVVNQNEEVKVEEPASTNQIDTAQLDKVISWLKDCRKYMNDLATKGRLNAREIQKRKEDTESNLKAAKNKLPSEYHEEINTLLKDLTHQDTSKSKLSERQSQCAAIVRKFDNLISKLENAKNK